MQKKSSRPGKGTSVVEIQQISPFGMWLYIDGEELFLPFDAYPWFLKATLDQIYNFEFHHKKYLHWPVLDIDVELDALKNPDAYPLTYKNPS